MERGRELVEEQRVLKPAPRDFARNDLKIVSPSAISRPSTGRRRYIHKSQRVPRCSTIEKLHLSIPHKSVSHRADQFPPAVRRTTVFGLALNFITALPNV